MLMALPLAAQKPEAKADSAQVEDTEVPIMMQVGETKYHGQTIPHILFPTLPKYAPMQFKNEREQQRYNRLVYNVKKGASPGETRQTDTGRNARLSGNTARQKGARCAHANGRGGTEKKQYGPALKKLTRSQGKLLLKLIDRECNQTGYHIAKAFMGSFKANLYRGHRGALWQQPQQEIRPRGRRPLHRTGGAYGRSGYHLTSKE